MSAHKTEIDRPTTKLIYPQKPHAKTAEFAGGPAPIKALFAKTTVAFIIGYRRPAPSNVAPSACVSPLNGTGDHPWASVVSPVNRSTPRGKFQSS